MASALIDKVPEALLRGSKRPIRTDYYRGRELVKTTRGLHPENASIRCAQHMRSNRYEATVAEVFDERDGVLHAVVKRTMDGSIHLLFKREYTEANAGVTL